MCQIISCEIPSEETLKLRDKIGTSVAFQTKFLLIHFNLIFLLKKAL